MTLRTVLVVGGTCTLLAGAIAAGSMARAEPTAPVPADSDIALASAVVADVDDEATVTSGTTTSEAAQALASRPDLLCARVPEAIVRVQNREKKLAAGASTPGSIAYLQARIARAEAAHQDQLVELLEKRLEFRKALVPFLPQKLAVLEKAQRTVCAPAARPSS
jgi:hypothetical protein